MPKLEHFKAQRQESPYDTRVILVLHRWDSELGKCLRPNLSKSRLIHSHPAGTYLFHTATSATVDLRMPPINWIMHICLADNIVDEQAAVAHNERMRYL